MHRLARMGRQSAARGARPLVILLLAAVLLASPASAKRRSRPDAVDVEAEVRTAPIASQIQNGVFS